VDSALALQYRKPMTATQGIDDASAYSLDAYDYCLPDGRIAQAPAQTRDASRLLVCHRDSGELAPSRFAELARFLPPGALLVANNSKVLPARVTGAAPDGKAVEFLLLTPLNTLKTTDEPDGWKSAPARGLLKGSRRRRAGERIRLSPSCVMDIVAIGQYGATDVTLFWQGNLESVFLDHGAMPLPPYIKRPSQGSDSERYQTVYANSAHLGSVAAPTAGLHFTPQLLEELQHAGFGWAETTLHVGYGTFSPVRCQDIREHVMHAEYAILDESTVEAIAGAKAAGRPVVAVGTTAVRTLEGVFALHGALRPYEGWIDIYIRPGHKFSVVDGLLTNFHLPKSSLLILVHAFAGRTLVHKAYTEAIRRDFRFFSYGDAMLVV